MSKENSADEIEVKRLREENTRLRGLLDDVFHDWVFDGLDDEGKMELLDRIAKELGDE